MGAQVGTALPVGQDLATVSIGGCRRTWDDKENCAVCVSWLEDPTSATCSSPVSPLEVRAVQVGECEARRMSSIASSTFDLGAMETFVAEIETSLASSHAHVVLCIPAPTMHELDLRHSWDSENDAETKQK